MGYPPSNSHFYLTVFVVYKQEPMTMSPIKIIPFGSTTGDFTCLRPCKIPWQCHHVDWTPYNHGFLLYNFATTSYNEWVCFLIHDMTSHFHASSHDEVLGTITANGRHNSSATSHIT